MLIRSFLLIGIIITTVMYGLSAVTMGIPITGEESPNFQSPQLSKLIGLDEFVQQVSSGESERLVGLYVRDLLAYKVTPQPNNQPWVVYNGPDLLTQFLLADPFGSIGLLAHHDQAGINFPLLQINQEIILIYGDGRQAHYRVHQTECFQALDPANPRGDFLSLTEEKKRYTVEELFMHTYGIKDRLVLQTCIPKDQSLFWGRLFIIARPELPGEDTAEGSIRLHQPSSN